MAMILVIDNYDSFTYNLVQYLGILAQDVRVVRNDRMNIEQIRTLNPDKIVLSPGPGRPEEAGITVEVVRQLGSHVPILGVCLGHQAICYAYGGTVLPAVRLMHGKDDQIYHDGQGIFSGIPQGFRGARYHSLAVDVEGVPELQVNATSDDGTVMAISHRRHPVFGIQFHPESILTENGLDILGNFLRLGVPLESEERGGKI